MIDKPLYSLQDLFDGKAHKGDYLEYKGEVYLFDGYDFGTIPVATHVETGEQIELPSY